MTMFVIEMEAMPDALLRVLGPFAVEQAELAAVRHDGGSEGARAVLQVVGLETAKAEHLARRLLQMVCVRGVSLRRLNTELQPRPPSCSHRRTLSAPSIIAKMAPGP